MLRPTGFQTPLGSVFRWQFPFCLGDFSLQKVPATVTVGEFQLMIAFILVVLKKKKKKDDDFRNEK